MIVTRYELADTEVVDESRGRVISRRGDIH